jgi:hypothetical protein
MGEWGPKRAGLPPFGRAVIMHLPHAPAYPSEKASVQPRAKLNVPWALDSEFLSSGRANAPEDVHSVQFSNGLPSSTVVLEDADALKRWLTSHRHIKTLYGFVLLPDLGSIREWLGENRVPIGTRGVQTRGRIRYGGFDAAVYDARPLLNSFGLRKLSECGELIGYPKLAKPEWLGLRAWQNDAEHQEFLEYARADAVITSRIVQWLRSNFNADPELHTSAGTLARDQFQLPKRLTRVKNTVILPPLERKVKNGCFAGRSEGFVVGYSPSIVYNDVKSLYPCSLVATRALEIVDVEPCDPSDLALGSDIALDEQRCGWLEGVFRTDNDLWGLPLRGGNNFYATGVISGLYHTFDLAAAKAEEVAVAHAYRPKFAPSKAHDDYADMLLDRLEGRTKDKEAMFAKAVLNSLSGKLGQSHPIARTSNFFAYSTVLAHSHLIMSRLFDDCPTKIYAMDTDSIFSETDMSGKHFELSDGDRSVPIIMDAKGRGNLSFFRSKNYILKPGNGSEPVVGRHGWVYFYEDFLRLADGTVTELRTRQDIKHTLLTRQREARKMATGRWKTKPVTLDLAKIKGLLTADAKRMRGTCDSYGLVMERRNVGSRAWRYGELMAMRNENPINYPRLGGGA